MSLEFRKKKLQKSYSLDVKVILLVEELAKEYKTSLSKVINALLNKAIGFIGESIRSTETKKGLMKASNGLTTEDKANKLKQTYSIEPKMLKTIEELHLAYGKSRSKIVNTLLLIALEQGKSD